MKKSNKILFGGFLAPIVLALCFILYFTINSTDDENFKLRNSNNYNFNVAPTI